MLPLLLRELRVALLRRNAHQQWLKAAWIAGAITLIFLILLGVGSPRHTGRTLFQLLFVLAIVRVAILGFSLTADLISEERRNGTLALLVLAGRSPMTILGQKLMGALFMGAYALLGGLPFFAFSFLTGGVPGSQFICSVTFLANALVLSIAIGLFASVLHHEGGPAQVAAQLIAAVLCVAAPLLHWLGILNGGSPSGLNWLVLSPAYPPYLVLTGISRGTMGLFWFGTFLTSAYSVVALGAAALLLHFTWRDQPERIRGHAGWNSWWQGWVRGNTKWRRALRSHFLAQRPFYWLAVQDRAPVLVAHALVLVAAALWVTGWVVMGSKWTTPTISFVSTVVLHQGLNLIGAYAAARRFAEERLSGGFEILLTAPLQTADIVEGQGRALIFQFRGVALGALAVDLVLWLSGLFGLPPGALVWASYTASWVLLLGFWFAMHLESASKAMWISAWTGRTGFAAIKAAGGRLWMLALAWFLLRHSPDAAFSDPHLVMFILAGLFLNLLYAFGRRRLLREKLTRELRQIASAPIPARDDKHFKSWDPNLVNPPAPGVALRTRKNQPVGRMDELNG